MTDAELVEAMALQIGYEIWGGKVDPRGKWKLAAIAALAVARPEIERGLLESMETASEGMRKAAPEQWLWDRNTTPPTLLPKLSGTPTETWRAMLAAFRKERGI